jgi:hypothetical protein
VPHLKRKLDDLGELKKAKYFRNEQDFSNRGQTSNMQISIAQSL